ncbi:ATP-dependent DNA helicase RecG [Jeotgalibaca sp. MA1X17-3]|nr:ATP-dependent DNA helicase RecG [Jeotgalibaca sp. MA1X17-3]UJF14937.1 ATP-dependent DNA helicase RecG [Jeotgalibaca sp. MA1X17-3]
MKKIKSIYDSIDVLPGVGPKRLEALHTLGIDTVYDLLTHFPFRYEDIQVKNLEEIDDQDKVTLKGTVVTPATVHHYGFKKSRLSFKMAIEDAIVMITFFNQPYLKDKIQLEEEIMVFGKWDALRQSLAGFKILGSSKNNGANDFESVYHVNKHIKQKTVVSIIKSALEEYYSLIPEIIPEELSIRYHLQSHKDAIRAMHFPKSETEFQQASRQVIYQEFLVYQMKLQLVRDSRKNQAKGISIPYNVEQLKEFIQKLPFELTDGQKRVVNEICRDLREPYVMNRLLQGDVGSGKTIVAVIAFVATILEGYQGAFMVPTEILAEQHYETLHQLFKGTPFTVSLLTGSTKPKVRKTILEELASGKLDLVIGTHALIQEDVLFHNLALVVTDEQHRFGVNQRKTLNEKGENPNVLYMTATPIPRTLAITVMGEMDVSILDQLPAGRIPIRTIWSKSSKLEGSLDFISKQLEMNRQAYIITPLIEKSEVLDLKNAEDVYQKVMEYYQGKWQIGLLHGRQKADEKEKMMRAFKDNEYQVLVSTTVIEVGLNVPNATVMVIQDAERFGLSQLHQLRGRVGRGSSESFCILLANPKTDNGKERMKIMTESTDGFYLSQKDLELRGSGDLFGIKQSGMPAFKYGDIIRNANILEVAHTDAVMMVSDEGFPSSSIYQPLLHFLKEERGHSTRLQ